ncbi:G patch domain-containing protein 1 homolog isoform X1 [Pogonomyrmex barbatus]|uniref:G patch domain-containing protein 1 homolog isoform X1 n=2 Tax=Pogonomyrmex barbatus TaxID=144034 RepID=A0A6I9X0R1_9HYME|nr:G patch domain-containing protein 1 homolog isoform X1 [Pogonomyrmex barbatus]
MADSDEENYATFGVPLDPLDEENIPRKKPVTIEDQYAYDAQGRRRFHGAFTGGFSAGYFNTVGTRDGWRPQQFKSSRSSKADNIVQRPEDFMDEEDTSLFGIAPKGIRATNDYADHGQRGKKRERINQEGPIPGTPVLQELLKPVKETVGIILLKKMGWKPGQGVGSRLTKREKQKLKLRNEKLLARNNSEMIGSNSEDSDDESNITFAPDDYEPFRCKPKDNYFGIGYSGLDRRKILSGHIDLFDSPAFCVQDKNKKLSIHGQAFGVGAFEADDEDIYEKEDMSSYDFALGPERKTKTRWSQDGPSSSQTDCLEGFVCAKERLESKKVFKPPELPKDFTPIHAIRKSRFYPPITAPVENNKRKEPLNAIDRMRILEDSDERSKKHTPTSTSIASNIISKTLNLHGKQQIEERRKLESQQKTIGNSWLDKLNAQNFIKGGVVGFEQEKGSLKKLEDFKESLLTLNANKSTESDSSNKSETAKLFLSDPDKQRRFEQYLVFSKNNEKNKLESIQPLSMTDWEREQEREEFERATKLEQSNNYMADKFVHSTDHTMDSTDPQKDIKEAVKLKMFGKLTRQRSEWKPTSIVCKRFNIPEPKVGCAPTMTNQKSTRFSVFDSLDWCSSSKFTKATDTIETQAEEIPQLSKKTKENVNETVLNITTSNNIPSNIYQSSEPVSEKFKIFEASYEKIFGKGIRSTPSATSKNVTQNEDDNLGNKTVQGIEEKEEEVLEPVSALKDQSDEKKDLFKAIFLSSSEDSDSETEENVDSEAVKSVLIGKDPKEINTQRNTSPPRGIFAKLDLDSLVTQPKRVNDESTASTISETSLPATNKSQNDLTDHNDVSDDTATAIPPDMYGPALPQRLLKQENPAMTTEAGNTSQLLKPVFRSVVVSKTTEDSKLGGKWVERDKAKKSKKKHKHKEHKEYKSPKHKKKSKKEKRSKH